MNGRGAAGAGIILLLHSTIYSCRHVLILPQANGRNLLKRSAKLHSLLNAFAAYGMSTDDDVYLPRQFQGMQAARMDSSFHPRSLSLRYSQSKAPRTHHDAPKSVDIVHRIGSNHLVKSTVRYVHRHVDATLFLVAGRLSHGQCGESFQILPEAFHHPSIPFQKLSSFRKILSALTSTNSAKKPQSMTYHLHILSVPISLE